MSKRKQLENLAVFIGMRAAHEVLIELTNKEETIPHMKKEVDMYNILILKLAEGNWNNDDIKKIKELALKRCNKKVEEYNDIGDNKYQKAKDAVEQIMDYLGLYANV